MNEEMVEKLAFILEDVQAQDLVRLDYLQRWSGSIKSDGHRWDARDIAKAVPYFEKHDIPPRAAIGILAAENSGHGSKMGMTWSSAYTRKMGLDLFGRGIRATTRRSEHDYAGGAVTLDRGTLKFLLSRPDIYKVQSDKYLAGLWKGQENIILENPEDWSTFIAYKVYRPGDPEMWAKTMLRELLKKGR